MHVAVNGVQLFLDVEGSKLVPDGPVMREKPTLLLLHGGPGADHSIGRPAYSALADIAQIIYLDHRGNGRSEDGPRECWNLAQWGDDVRAFCDALGIVDPIVLGTSLGGMVALAYATCHPTHPSKLVLISTEAIGGSYRERRVALYTRIPRDPDMARRAVRRPEVQLWFTRPGGESHSFNMFPDLHRIRCPTLVLAGEDDPMHPIESQADLAAALPAGLAQFERFENCRHAVVPDAPERAMAVIRDFILRPK